MYGPNGFYRAFRGGVSGRHTGNLQVRAVYDEQGKDIELVISNRASQSARINVFNRYTSRTVALELGAGDSESKSWSLNRTSGWYDLTITVDGDPRFHHQVAGHLEDGEDSISDPLMGGLL